MMLSLAVSCRCSSRGCCDIAAGEDTEWCCHRQENDGACSRLLFGSALMGRLLQSHTRVWCKPMTLYSIISCRCCGRGCCDVTAGRGVQCCCGGRRRRPARRLLLTVVFAMVANSLNIDRLMEKPIHNQRYALVVVNAAGWCAAGRRPTSV